MLLTAGETNLCEEQMPSHFLVDIIGINVCYLVLTANGVLPNLVFNRWEKKSGE